MKALRGLAALSKEKRSEIARKGGMTKRQAPRGFAAMSEEDKQRIRSMGGKASPMKFTKGDKRASEAGKVGGKVSKRGPKDGTDT